VEPLIARLADADAGVRRAAAGALGSLKDPRAVEPLIARLADADTSVRRVAAGALVRIGDMHGISALKGLLGSKKSNEREFALEALAQREEEIDRQLLSQDLDGLAPWLNIAQPLTNSWVHHAAKARGWEIDEVRRRFERLAKEYGFTLKWQPQ
jgi:HEAT repeat protein